MNLLSIVVLSTSVLGLSISLIFGRDWACHTYFLCMGIFAVVIRIDARLSKKGGAK